MIRSLEIFNFQSHKGTRLEFSKGVNVITGSSDSGKTAIIRALRWLIWNRPTGDEFRSSWGGETAVNIELNDEYKIERNKTNNDNGYTLSNQETVVPFKAIRTDVPEEIVKVLNINEINLQGQLDAPFLLSNSPGEVAQHFNKVARLDKIDSGLQNVQKGIRQLEQDIKYTSDQVTQREEELKKFEHLEKFEIEVEALEETAKQLISKKNALKELELTCGELQNVNDEIESYTHLLSLESLVNYIDDKITLLGEKKVELIKLEKLIDHIQQVKNDISVKERLLQFESQVNQIIWDIDQRDTFELQLGDLGSDTHDLIALEKQIFHYTHTEKALQIQFNKEMGDTCILCGQSIKK